MEFRPDRNDLRANLSRTSEGVYQAMNKVELRLSRPLLDQILQDLRRPHQFAAERVGFAWGVFEDDADSKNLILMNGYEPVEEPHYIDDPTVGVRISGDAIRWAMQLALDKSPERTCVFHVHLHDFKGKPRPSRIDCAEIPPVVRSIARLAPDVPHGFIILSVNSISAWMLPPGSDKLVEASCFVCGWPSILVEGTVK